MGGGGQGLGPNTAGAAGPPQFNYSGGGGGGGLSGPGGNGGAGFYPGGTGGGAASLMAISVGGTYTFGGTTIVTGGGGTGFGGGGAVSGFDSTPFRIAGGGGGGYGGGRGAGGYNTAQVVLTATGGYSYLSPTGSSTSVSPGTSGAAQNQNGVVTLAFPNHTGSAAFTTNPNVCTGSTTTTLQGTVSATGSWTLTLTDGTVRTGSGSTFSIPVSPVTSTTYAIQSLYDQKGIANTTNLTSKATVTVNPLPTVSLTNNGPITCQSSVTLTASGGTSYTFTLGSTVLAGANTSNTRVVTSTGTYTVRVANVNSCTGSASTTISQITKTLTVANPTTSTPVVNQYVSYVFNASNGLSPYSFSLASGNLPPGLSLSVGGFLSGTLTQAGSFTSVIRARDTNGCTGLGSPYVANVISFSITSQPVASLTACLGNPVSVSVGVLGAPTAYQWYKNNVLVTGQTSATLSLPSVSSANAGSYAVVITDGVLSLTSTPVTLTIPPARYYVKANATGANTGLDWANAFTDLQSALQAGTTCLGSLQEIWVAGGIYKPTATTNRAISFAMRNGVAIYGGFVGSETALSQRPAINIPPPSSTTLSGEIGSPSSTSDNAYHVISNPAGLTNSAILDGFVVTGGNANGSDPNDPGGGLLNNGRGSGNNCSPLIRQCVFVANQATYGGAIGNFGDSDGISNPVLINCIFQNNTTTQSGGAIYNKGSYGTSSPRLTNCAFQNNVASGYGGAIYNESSGNYGISSPVLTNCSFQSNMADLGGNVMYNNGSSSPQLTNCVLFNNGEANIFYNSMASSLTASYSLFEASVSGYVSLTGNLTTTTSPFASTTSTQLAPTSPAINTGDPTSTTVGTIDLAGNLRIIQGRIDMGAIEWGTTCQGLVTSLKAGNWDDTTVWSCNVVPSTTDIVQLNHVVSLPVTT